MSKSGTNKKKRGAPNTPLRRSTRRAPPIRHLPGIFTSLFTTTKKNSNNRRLTVLNEEPFVYSIKNFLTKAEIEYMKNVVKDTRLKRSYTDDGGKTKKKKIVSEDRTSTFTFLAKFQDHLVRRALKRERITIDCHTFVLRIKLIVLSSNIQVRKIETRAADLVGLPASHVEPIQIVKYRKGQHFDTHHDLGPWDPENDSVEFIRSPTRLVTLFVYVNTVENGGETEFPVCKLKCQPTEGTAILWSNVCRDEKNGEWVPDPRTIHRGCPVQSGRKIGMNIWITDKNLIG